MSPLLVLIVAFLVVGLICVIDGIRYAPEGSEGENGFTVTWRNNAPEIEDVSCVWVAASGAAIERADGEVSGARIS